MWVPGKIALTAAVCGAAALAACSGPLDSPTPRPPIVRDAGADVFRRDVAGADRGAGGAPVIRDASPDLIPDASDASDAFDAFDAFDAPRDGVAGRRMDAAGDGGLDGRGAGGRAGGGGGGGGSGGAGGSWPVVPGCVTGFQPQPAILRDVSELVVGCAPLTRIVARVTDLSRNGLVFRVALDPPVDGFSVSTPGTLCSGTDTVPITVTALSPSARRPGDSGVLSVRVTIQGPGPPGDPIVFPLQVVQIDFALQDQVIDFGLVPVGTSRSNPVTVTNQASSAGIGALYPDPRMTDAFSVMASGPGGLPQVLEPGATGALLTAYFFPPAAGAYESFVNISPFDPIFMVDPICGELRKLTLRGQGYQPR